MNVSIVDILAILASGITTVLIVFSQKISKKKKNEINVINEKIQTLDLMSNNLKEMIVFLNNQKKKITEEQLLLEDIKQQRKAIEPLLSTEKQVVEALLKAQIRYGRKNIWIDRAIAFFFGIASSMIAAILLR